MQADNKALLLQLEDLRAQHAQLRADHEEVKARAAAQRTQLAAKQAALDTLEAALPRVQSIPLLAVSLSYQWLAARPGTPRLCGPCLQPAMLCGN